MDVNDDFLELYVILCGTISKPVRLKIIDLLKKGKQNVSAMQKEFDIPMSNLSNHLNALYRAGIIGKEKDGNFVNYFLADPELPKGIAKMQTIVKSINKKRTGIK